MTYISALATIELALTHAAVYQAVWTQCWQLMVGMLGIAVLLLALQKDRGNLPVHLQMEPVSNANHPGKMH